MKKRSSVLWGLVLIAVGAVIALNATGLTSINLFFEGWWTLFIIVPCLIGLITEREKTGNLIGLGIGVLLLLSCQKILRLQDIWEYVLAAVIILIGVKMIFGNALKNKTVKIQQHLEEGGKAQHSCFAAFTGNHVCFDDQNFYGAELNAVFGGIQYDLRRAIITQDCVIKATAIFAGIDILLPENVNVKVTSNSVFGGVDNKRKDTGDHDAVTLYITGSAVFGGVDIQ